MQPYPQGGERQGTGLAVGRVGLGQRIVGRIEDAGVAGDGDAGRGLVHDGQLQQVVRLGQRQEQGIQLMIAVRADTGDAQTEIDLAACRQAQGGGLLSGSLRLGIADGHQRLSTVK